jgi:predicted dehydrogenase
MFLTWAARGRETTIRFIGSEGMCEWEGGTLRLERGGKVEEHDFTPQLDKATYPNWFGGLFAEFADAVATRDGRRQLKDIAQVAAVLEAAYSGARRRT